MPHHGGERSFRHIVPRVATYGNATRDLAMLELPVTTLCHHQVPTCSLKKPDDFANLHDVSTSRSTNRSLDPRIRPYQPRPISRFDALTRIIHEIASHVGTAPSPRPSPALGRGDQQFCPSPSMGEGAGEGGTRDSCIIRATTCQERASIVSPRRLHAVVLCTIPIYPFSTPSPPRPLAFDERRGGIFFSIGSCFMKRIKNFIVGMVFCKSFIQA